MKIELNASAVVSGILYKAKVALPKYKWPYIRSIEGTMGALSGTYFLPRRPCFAAKKYAILPITRKCLSYMFFGMCCVCEVHKIANKLSGVTFNIYLHAAQFVFASHCKDMFSQVWIL